MAEKRELDFGGLGMAATILAATALFTWSVEVIGTPDEDFYDLSDALVCMGGQATCAARARETARVATEKALKAQVASLKAQARELGRD